MKETVWKSDYLYMRLESLERGVKDCLGPPDPAIVVHVGNTVILNCDFEGKRHRGLRAHGDVNIIPANMPSRWESAEEYSELSLRLPRKLMDDIASRMEIDPARIELREHFQLRDAHLRHIGLALKAEFEAGFPHGRLFAESLATALGVILVHQHSNAPRALSSTGPKMSMSRLRDLLSYIDEHISHELSLRELAGVAGLSVSHCKATFRSMMGMPLHQYVIQRRVEHARRLLDKGTHTILETALSTGFSSPSHLALHLKRQLGSTPGELLRAARARVRKRND